MKAVICTKYGPPEVLQIKEVEKPTPKKKEVCIKIQATAVTSSDCIIRGYQVPASLWIPMGLALGFTKPRQPILGIVLVGEIESVGQEVTLFKKGDQVFGWDLFPTFGAYAEYKCMSEKGMLAIKPTRLNRQEAAALPYGGLLALHYLKKGNLNPAKKGPQKVLIYGASGAVGSAAVQLAKHFGAEVAGVCGTANLEWVKALGAGKVLDYTQEDMTAQIERYDFILDAVGKRKRSTLKALCKKALAPGGKYISVDDGTPKPQVEDLYMLKELAESGQLKPVIDRIFPLEQIAEAHRYVDQGHKKGNVIITVGP